ncbi:MAG: rhomboid family intramembrane serine protease [Brevundimonas subvibrioides]|uniref:Rhomboid family intramembrane serine protease n=1 Tax=Brevundimonas subvibrioides TaxID=74313 RepID=A0A258FBX8_9CAUL|nr:MAG: rhomboid family intramembrane serine protease [Brevundimonas subvibrioides]
MEPSDGRFDGPPPRERIFNVPLVALSLGASMPALYWFQERAHTYWLELAFRPVDLAEGRYAGLVTSMLVHGGWAHALMNAVGALTFGAPLARLFGGGTGVGVFLALYIVSGAAATLGYGLLHWGGLRGRVLPLTDGGVIRSAIAWMGVNAVIGLIGFAPGAEGARIAWEAHAFGFLFGILAIGPLARVFARPDERFDSAAGTGDPVP